VQEHIQGKQYLGWSAIREELKKLQAKFGVAKEPERERQRGKDVDRERDRTRCVCKIMGCASAAAMIQLVWQVLHPRMLHQECYGNVHTASSQWWFKALKRTG
jgi:hypothetical protein